MPRKMRIRPREESGRRSNGVARKASAPRRLDHRQVRFGREVPFRVEAVYDFLCLPPDGRGQRMEL